jgi:hypothetical protein
MRLEDGQEWRCPNGHVLGMIIRNGSGRPMLALYRRAMEVGKEPPPERPSAACESRDLPVNGEVEDDEGEEEQEVDVMGVVDLKVGTVHDIRCSICGAMKPWVEKGKPGEEWMPKCTQEQCTKDR